MRIVAVSWRDLAHPFAGGAELVIDRLLSGLASRGHDVTLVCGGPVAERGDYAVVNGGGTYTQYLRAPWICLSRYRDADVVIDAENGLPYFSPLWRRGPSVCLVHHVHTDQWRTRFPGPVASAASTIERRVMPAVYRNRLMVAVSSSTAEELRVIGVAEQNIRVIESGVDIPSGPLPQKAAEPLFVSLSRLVPHKRVNLLLEAWMIASRVIPGRLVIAGDGPELDTIRHQASSIPRVEVVGRISEGEKGKLLGQAWAVVSAAHHEGWGMSVMEAAALGTPALAVDAPGIRDAVVNHVTGVLVRAPEEGLREELAASWVALADSERCKAMGVSARRRATQFTWERSVGRWEALLEEVKPLQPKTRYKRAILAVPSKWGRGQTKRAAA